MTSQPARLAAALLALGALAGCGARSDAAPPAGSKPTPTATAGPITEPAGADACQRVGQTEDGPLQLCFVPNRDDHGRFVVGSGAEARTLPIPPPESHGPILVGHWDWAALSPDGSSLLAQWSAECEVPIAFFVSLPAGSPRPVSGETNWGESPDSLALGWTTDGAAIVFLPHGLGCGTGSEAAGVYLYSEPGAGRRVVATHGEEESPVPRSLRPRAASLVSVGT